MSFVVIRLCMYSEVILLFFFCSAEKLIPQQIFIYRIDVEINNMTPDLSRSGVLSD